MSESFLSDDFVRDYLNELDLSNPLDGEISQSIAAYKKVVSGERNEDEVSSEVVEALLQSYSTIEEAMVDLGIVKSENGGYVISNDDSVEAKTIFCLSELVSSYFGYSSPIASAPSCDLENPKQSVIQCMEAVEDIASRESITSYWLEHDVKDWNKELSDLLERLKIAVGES